MHSTKTGAGIFISALALITACGKPDITPSSLLTADSFITAGELSKGSRVNPIVKSEVASELNDVSDFYDDEPSKFAEFTEDDDCVGKLMNEQKVTSYGAYVGVGVEMDVTQCFKELREDPNTNSLSVMMRLAFQVGCDNQDFASFDGKTFGEVVAIDKSSCHNATQRTYLSNVRFVTKIKSSEDGIDYDAENIAYFVKATADGKPCTETVRDNVLLTSDGCLITERKFWSGMKVNGKPTEKEGTEDFTQLEMIGITSAAGDSNAWYQSGKMKTTLNNWTGDVIYSGTTTAPTYSLTNGSETATGSLGARRGAAGLGGIFSSITPRVTESLRRAAAEVGARSNNRK